ncbi:MAG: hypothetical protein Q8R25_03365 [bacterium]|nr:hypothetical protein [bacterium]
MRKILFAATIAVLASLNAHATEDIRSIQKMRFFHRYGIMKAMSTVSISGKIAGGIDDLVVISRREYENLLRTRARARGEIPMTQDVKRALLRSRKNMKAGTMLSMEDVKRRLASRN